MSVLALPGRFAKKAVVDPNKALFKEYKLTKRQTLDLILRKVALAFVATCIGSAIYFLITQTHYQVGYPKGNSTFVNVYLGHGWDNLIHKSWWTTARHDIRKVLIGFIATLLVGAYAVKFKVRERASSMRMFLSVPMAFLAAIATATGLILFFNWAVPSMQNWGVATNEASVSQWIGSGTLQLTVIGIVAGLVARLFLNRTFDTLQLMSIERKINNGIEKKWWWNIVYAPNYIRRHDYLVASGHECKQHGAAQRIILAGAAPVLTLLVAFGIWLNYFGPAAHAH